MKSTTAFAILAFTLIFVLSACEKEDKRRPDVNEISLYGETTFVTVEAGEIVDLTVVVEDNIELSQIRAELNPVGTLGIDHDGNWSELLLQEASGEEGELKATLTVPFESRGNHLIVATALDDQGLESFPFELDFIVENNVAPILNFSGSDPAPEEDNLTVRVPVGDAFRIIYGVTDGEGVDSVFVRLFDANGELEFENTHAAGGQQNFAWMAEEIIPNTDVASNYTYQVEAKNLSGLFSQAVHPIEVYVP